MSKLTPAIALGLLLAAGSATAATVTIVNTNDPGVGFNDPSIVANTDAGCVVGETLGACRLRVFTTAANQWGRLLSSSIEIRVQARMIPQTCSGNSAVLGSAGPIGAFSNFANAPRAGTFYPSALANALAGSDLDPASDDISTNFNVSIDSGCLTGTAGWWYGVDPSVPAPANRSALLPVVFHEIGHGLGFTSLVNTSSGAYFTPGPSIWAHFLYDTETNQRWLDMNNAQRVASAINDPDLVWSGRQVSIAAPRFLRSPARVLVSAPAGIAGSYEAQTASFGPDVASSPVTGDVVLVNDGVSGAGSPAGTPTDGCEAPFVNAAAVAGRIALIDRGFCPFVQKVLNAQAAGAIGVIIANNTSPGLPGMGGTSAAVTIASLGVSQDLGNAMKANLPNPGVTASLTTDPSLPAAGTRFNCVRMFAPNPVQSGSSVSHFHSDAFPNLLMEPALTGTIFDRVDLTADLFRDIGWTVAGDDVFFAENFEDGPCTFAP